LNVLRCQRKEYYKPTVSTFLVFFARSKAVKNYFKLEIQNLGMRFGQYVLAGISDCWESGVFLKLSKF